MKTIVTTAVMVDRAACERLAALIRAFAVPPDREDASLEGFTAEEAGNLLLPLVTICHQTSPPGKPPLEGTLEGRYLGGWDYLSAKWVGATREDRGLLDVSRWTRMSAEDLVRIFRDSSLGDRLAEPEERAALIRDLGEAMQRKGWRSLQQIHGHCGGWLLARSPGLFETLSQFRAYRDPVRKKSCFLLALMRNSAHWRYQDEENLGPPVDYHEIRGHLRLATVAIGDGDLRTKLLEGRTVTAEEDIAIRAAVYEAIMLVSELSRVRDASRLHYLFWNVFRSCCTRETPHCSACPPGCPLPARYAALGEVTGPRRCAFYAICPSAGAGTRLTEHAFPTDLY